MPAADIAAQNRTSSRQGETRRSDDRRSDAVQNDTRRNDGRRMTVRPSGRVVTQEVRLPGGFSEINSRGIVDVEYRQTRAGQTRVEIRGRENLVGYVEIRNTRGVLEIDWPRNVTVRGEFDVTVIVSSPRMDKITTMGTGDIKIAGTLESDAIELASYGTGDIEFGRIKGGEVRMLARGSGDIEGGTLEARNVDITVQGTGDVDVSRLDAASATITVSGTGDVDVNGRVRDAVFKLRGTGDIEADGLRAENVNATLSGTGDISCYASLSLRATASGIGTITVAGNPSAVEIKGLKRAVRFR